MSAIYCRREITTTSPEGRELSRFCLVKIKTANALDWCDGCQARLPLWPAGDPEPVAHCGRAIAELFGLDKLPPSLVVIHDDEPTSPDPMTEASTCPACGSQAPLREDGECPDCRTTPETVAALTTPLDLFPKES